MESWSMSVIAILRQLRTRTVNGLVCTYGKVLAPPPLYRSESRNGNIRTASSTSYVGGRVVIDFSPRYLQKRSAQRTMN
jgi:hypothetical protein